MLFFSCKTEKKEEHLVGSEGSLIETHELRAQLDHPDIKIIDVRNATAFVQGHIEGAIQISRTEMERAEDTIPGMRADAAQMQLLLSNKGIKSDDWLVIYDDRGNPEAARLWCILSGYGMDRIKLLNGGLKAWEEDGFELVRTKEEVMPARFSWQQSTQSSPWISADEIARSIENKASSLVLIDTRTPDEYHGVRQKKNALRAGHIPGAVHLDWADLIDFHGDHRLKQIEDIHSLLAKFEISAKDSIILYCHSGVRSSLATFVFREVLGYPNVWNYDGSWTEWSRLTHYPIEVDSITTKFN